MQMATNVEWPPLGPLPTGHVKLTFDLHELGSFTQTLCQVLTTLGIPNEHIKVTCTGELAQGGGIERPVVTSIEFPASTTLTYVLASTELTIEDIVEEGLQAISHKALCRVMRDHYGHLQTTEFHLLPQALDPSLTPCEQSFAAGRVILAEENSCLRTSAIHLLEQDRYVTQLEQKRRQDRALLWEYQERASEEARVQASL
jgi:hypothetical protein